MLLLVLLTGCWGLGFWGFRFVSLTGCPCWCKGDFQGTETLNQGNKGLLWVLVFVRFKVVSRTYLRERIAASDTCNTREPRRDTRDLVAEFVSPPKSVHFQFYRGL